MEIFDTLGEAKVLVERWRRDYNQIRPHSALAYRPPAPEAKLPRSQEFSSIPCRALQMAPSLTQRVDSFVGQVSWTGSVRGKRGGIRTIYFHHAGPKVIYMLTAYAKADRDDLTPADRKTLSRLVTAD